MIREYGTAERSLHDKRFEVGHKGSLTEHECRGRECTHSIHQQGSGGRRSTKEKLSEAGRKGVEAQPREAMAKEGQALAWRKGLKPFPILLFT